MRRACHLSRDQEINFTTVIFIVSKAFVNLRASNLRETSRKRIDCFAILEQAHDIVDSNPRALNASGATVDPGIFRDVAVGRGLNGHIRMVASPESIATWLFPGRLSRNQFPSSPQAGSSS
jgi:hypothetical protein